MEEKIIICKECGTEFLFTVGEQNFYKEKGLNEPRFCRSCRQDRRERFSKINNDDRE